MTGDKETKVSLGQEAMEFVFAVDGAPSSNMGNNEDTPQKVVTSNKLKELRFTVHKISDLNAHSRNDPSMEVETSPISDASKTPLRFEDVDSGRDEKNLKKTEAEKKAVNGKPECERGRRRGRDGIRTREKTPFSPRIVDDVTEN